MSFLFVLWRTIILSFIIINDVILIMLAAVALYDKTGGVFQGLVVLFGILSLLTVIGCLCHQCVNRGEESSNTRSLIMFTICGLLSFALSATLTVHARQDLGLGMCNDFVRRKTCAPAGAQLGLAYVSLVIAMVGFVISWLDKYPGAVKVTPRYPITKAPSSRYAAHAHELDGHYTSPPEKSIKKKLDPKWSIVPL